MTASGRRFFPLAPRLEDVSLADIAHALGAVNRFGGHTRWPYSVAQHSVLVSRQLALEGPAVALLGLLHDASEAYLGDVPRPLKQDPVFAAYRLAEARLEAVILEALGVLPLWTPGVQALVKGADRRMLRTEQAQLMPPPAPGEDREDVAPYPLLLAPWSADSARARFLDTYDALRADLAPLAEPAR